ncbi:concanavalin A-like lectin/glucanase domain-containing protein [Schizothecium vesticola]|uniref:Concanavalin A-like lectin/glucanase domain-containing protein n=1 Tax=Schizothecium vesticola TaxID=314040 RepID=A0AA40K9C5_9PEZI|nr:concanavalin A-like lectin/glucanase domain-containing protein [Schizothecium vesticola]
MRAVLPHIHHLRHAAADRHVRCIMMSWTRACVRAFLFLSVSTNYAAAQLSEFCGRQTICPPVPALGETIHIDFRNQSLGDYIAKVNGPLDFDISQQFPPQKEDGKGLVLLMTGVTDAPKVEVPQHIFFGRVDVEMRSAPGAGIVTSLLLTSPDGDEVNFEWTGANDTTVQTVFFSKGNTSLDDRLQHHPVNGPSTNFHTYSFLWETKWLQWLVDGNVVRTVNYRKEEDGTSNGFPQAPMTLLIACWVAGRNTTAAGTVEWAGGLANFTDGPKRAYIKTLNITDDAYNSPGRQPKYYTWNDQSGLYTSIGVKYEDTVEVSKETPTNSTVTNLETTFTPSGLSTGGIAGIVVGFVAALAMIGALAAVVMAQRKKRAKRDKEEAAALARDAKQGGMSAEEVGGVDNKPELDGCVLVELSSYQDKGAQELDGKGDVRLEMSEDNNPQELSPVGIDEREDVYYEKLRSVGELKKPRDDPQDGGEVEDEKPGTDNGSNVGS